MAYLGRNNQNDLVFQPNTKDLKIGEPSEINAGSLNADNLTIASGATLPAFESLFVKDTGNSSLGEVIQGLWHGSGIEEAYGGTGQSSYSAGDLLVADGTTSLTTLASGAEGQVLSVTGGALAWRTEPHPLSFAVNDILYADSTTTLASLPSGAEGQELAVVGGALAWRDEPLPSLVNTAATQYDASANDDYIMASGQVLVTLPSSASLGQTHTVKDVAGLGSTSGVTVSGIGSELIDGQATYLLNNDYQSANFVWNGTFWSVV